jgi:hypothetical protein
MSTAAPETTAAAPDSAAPNGTAPDGTAPDGEGGVPACHAAVSAATAPATAMAAARQRGCIVQRQGREAGNRRDGGDGKPARQNFTNATLGHVPPFLLLSKAA